MEGINPTICFYKEKMERLTTVSFKTKAQIEDSGISVHSSIAEGYARRYLKKTIQYNLGALASLAENYTQVLALVASDDINSEWFDEYDELHYSIENKLISYNRSLLSKLKSKDEWKSDYKISELITNYNIE